jgi:hypothetical protein
VAQTAWPAVPLTASPQQAGQGEGAGFQFKSTITGAQEMC